jgi:hypothetical protein
VEDEDRQSYEERLRDSHPDPLWWERLSEHKWLVFWLAVAVIAMIVVGYVVN